MVHVWGNRDGIIVEKTFLSWNTNIGQWNVHSSKLRIAMDNSHPQKEVHPAWRFQIFFHFTPILAEIIQFDKHIFPRGESTTNWHLEEEVQFPQTKLGK